MYRSDLARPACRHDPAWRNTGFRTAATACRGGGNSRLRSSSPPRMDDIALRTPQGDGSRPPQCDGCIGWKPRGGVPEHNPALTQLCSSLARRPPQLRAEGTPLATPRPDLRCTSAESLLSWRGIAHRFSRCGALFGYIQAGAEPRNAKKRRKWDDFCDLSLIL